VSVWGTRLTIVGPVTGAGVVVLSAAAWSGTTRPWDGGLELWEWTVCLAVAATVLDLLAIVGSSQVRLVAASAGAVLLVVALAMWLRQWWLLAFPSGNGPVYVAPVSQVELRARSDTPTVAGFAAGGLLLVATAASLGTVRRMIPRPDQSPAG